MRERGGGSWARDRVWSGAEMMSRDTSQDRDTGAGPLSPKSEASLARFGEFSARIRERLENGKRVYGDSSFERPPVRLLEEIRQEVLDVAGWAFILYERLAELELVLAVGDVPVESCPKTTRLSR